MILKAKEVLTLTSDRGYITAETGDLFWSNSSDAVDRGYAEKLSHEEELKLIKDSVKSLCELLADITGDLNWRIKSQKSEKLTTISGEKWQKRNMLKGGKRQ
jgi:hypothetical protein